MSIDVRPSPTASLDLDILDDDLIPTFVIRIGQHALDFSFAFCNEAFRREGFVVKLEEQSRVATLFRSWAQALGDYKPHYNFQGRRWFPQEAGRNRTWKILRAAEAVPNEEVGEEATAPDSEEGAVVQSDVNNRGRLYHRSKDEILRDMKVNKSVLEGSMPRTNLTARWVGLQTMMEMSDVGVFEYNTEGKLIHANEAWYRLSSHPRNLPAHVEYSFMDLVYLDDQALVMSMWNKLASGNPVTFEMRWKGAVGTSNPAQWVLTACVPVFNEEGTLISIAGNTIDIMAQKMSQEIAQARVEALEQARKSEQKFARFATLSPIGIYIFVPGKGKFVQRQAHIGFDTYRQRHELRQRSVFRADWTLTSAI